jgi:hypothetical protein
MWKPVGINFNDSHTVDRNMPQRKASAHAEPQLLAVITEQAS